MNLRRLHRDLRRLGPSQIPIFLVVDGDTTSEEEEEEVLLRLWFHVSTLRLMSPDRHNDSYCVLLYLSELGCLREIILDLVLRRPDLEHEGGYADFLYVAVGCFVQDVVDDFWTSFQGTRRMHELEVEVSVEMDEPMSMPPEPATAAMAIFQDFMVDGGTTTEEEEEMLVEVEVLTDEEEEEMLVEVEVLMEEEEEEEMLVEVEVLTEEEEEMELVAAEEEVILGQWFVHDVVDGFSTSFQRTRRMPIPPEPPLKSVLYEKEQDDGTSPAVREKACPICLQDFDIGEEVGVTPCAHPFHRTCLARWLQEKPFCPLCRSLLQDHASGS